MKEKKENQNEETAKNSTSQEEQLENSIDSTSKEEAEAAEDKAAETTDEAAEEDSIQKDLEQAHAALADMNDKYLRLSAEFDNFRKRTLKEKAELILNGGEKTIVSLLPVLDDLERALDNMEKATDVNAIKEGVNLIYQKFLKALAQNGVKPIDTTGQALDTDYHEAIALVPAPAEEAKGKIIDCVQKGYTLNEKVIRHAKVVVGQ
ncbi:MAG: nucleotide exchange factor GrpE [Bacteroidaceae bacterium]|jgi:molecular chaperone GrpE